MMPFVDTEVQSLIDNFNKTKQHYYHWQIIGYYPTHIILIAVDGTVMVEITGEANTGLYRIRYFKPVFNSQIRECVTRFEEMVFGLQNALIKVQDLYDDHILYLTEKK